MKEDINQEILRRYFDNTCSKQEREMVEKWLDPQRTWNSSDLESVSLVTREKIWSAISAHIDPAQTSRTKIIRMVKYAAACAAAISVYFLSFPEDDIHSVITADHSIVFEEIHYDQKVGERNQISELYRIVNPTDKAVFLTTNKNGRRYQIVQKTDYLTIVLDEPGVLGDKILILSPEQFNMLPDVPMANQVAAVINQTKSSDAKLL